MTTRYVYSPIYVDALCSAEKVWTYDHLENQWRLCRVLETFKNDFSGEVISVSVAGETIESTSNHPWWVVRGAELSNREHFDHVPTNPVGYQGNGRWVNANRLQVGDVLLLRSGEESTITNLSSRYADLPVYNLHVEELNCYAVGQNQLLVHNLSVELTSLISKSPYARRLAEGLNNAAQRDVDNLIARFIEGNKSPGIGTRALGGGFFELRGANAGRVIIKQTGENTYDIIGKFQGHALLISA